MKSQPKEEEKTQLCKICQVEKPWSDFRMITKGNMSMPYKVCRKCTGRNSGRAQQKIIPPGVTFDRALKSGLIGRITAPAYLQWIRQQPCCVCGVTPVDPSHLNGHGFEGIGTKTPDYWAIPLCRPHHEELHANRMWWEGNHGSQTYWTMVTMTQAIVEGVL